MAREQIVQKSVGLYPSDWAELEVLSRAFHTSQSGVLRMFIDFWRKNHDPGDSQIREQLKTSAEAELTPS